MNVFVRGCGYYYTHFEDVAEVWGRPRPHSYRSGRRRSAVNVTREREMNSNLDKKLIPVQFKSFRPFVWLIAVPADSTLMLLNRRQQIFREFDLIYRLVSYYFMLSCFFLIRKLCSKKEPDFKLLLLISVSLDCPVVIIW